MRSANGMFILMLTLSLTVVGCGSNKSGGNVAKSNATDEAAKDAGQSGKDTPTGVDAASKNSNEGKTPYKGVKQVYSREKLNEYESLRALSDITWMVGGGLLMAGGYYTNKLGTGMAAFYEGMVPSFSTSGSQRVAAEAVIRGIRNAFGKIGLNRVAEPIAERLIISHSAKSLMIKRAASKGIQWGGRTAMAIGGIGEVWAVADIFMLSAEDASDATLHPADRYEELKRAMYTLAADPHNFDKLSQASSALQAFLLDVINSLKLEYNNRLLEMQELSARDGVAAEKMAEAEKIFVEFEVENKKLIETVAQCHLSLALLEEINETNVERINVEVQSALAMLKSLYEK